MNAYEQAAARLAAAYTAYEQAKAACNAAERELEAAERELAVASANLARHEDRPGIPKARYR